MGVNGPGWMMGSGMSGNIRPVQEEELHAYVDGWLDQGRRVEIDRLLELDQALRQRLLGWQAGRAALQEAFAFKLREPVPPRLDLGRLMEARSSSGTGRFALAASVALALLVGAGCGWFAGQQARPGEVANLGREAATAYRVFAPDRDHPVEMGPSDRAELASWAERRLGRTISVPDLSRFGYSLLGGRMLATPSSPALMLIYEDAGGTRVSLFLQPMSHTVSAPTQPVRAETGVGQPVEGFAWISGQLGYGLVAEGSTSLRRLADHVQHASPG